MVEFMVDQKAVRKLARAKFAPARGRNLGVFGKSDIGQDEFDTLPRTQPKRRNVKADARAARDRMADKLAKEFSDADSRRKKSRTHGSLWKLQGDAKAMRASLEKKYSRGEAPGPAFDSFVKAAAKHLGMSIKDVNAAAKVAFSTYTKQKRRALAAMDNSEFEAHLANIPAKQRDAAKVVRLGIKGPGLTERDATVEFLRKLSPLVETNRRETNLVSRLRGCFTA